MNEHDAEVFERYHLFGWRCGCGAASRTLSTERDRAVAAADLHRSEGAAGHLLVRPVDDPSANALVMAMEEAPCAVHPPDGWCACCGAAPSTTVRQRTRSGGPVPLCDPCDGHAAFEPWRPCGSCGGSGWSRSSRGSCACAKRTGEALAPCPVTDECKRGIHGDCDDFHDAYCACDCHRSGSA